MQSALDAFNSSLARARHMHGLHNSLNIALTVAVDLTDILRAELVMAVSALDHYVHELTRLGMLECWAGTRVKTEAFNRFPLPIATTALLTSPATSMAALDNAIRTKHNHLSFQQPEKIADAIRLFSSSSLWDEVAAHIGSAPKTLKATLAIIIDRRNKIAHESDVDPSFPNQRWPIEPLMVENMVNDIEKIGHAIHAICV
ncbi:MAG: HEPN domain-containing protein [Pseudomonadota bacterium]|jgi:RiboL-PSP-HEPN|uniref:HEPN domain-containing protein n=1 Tax=Sphingobium yanoikuyae TaxID=13690 RepID=UPI0013772F93|nr:HEPN domain-containing protein [Sphingobium yanoikuyae]NBB41734.1 hypothetical protein [Sphingobium yanoikuyae]